MTVRAKCSTCPSMVVVDACETCARDGRDASCDECGGRGWTVDGEPCEPDYLLCSECWDRSEADRTRAWCE